MKIGLFPGSFNPIHIGHLIIAQYLLNHESLDKIRFIISPQNPLKKRRILASPEDRFQMVHLAIEDNPALEASDIEFHLGLPSFTIDTLDSLKKIETENEFSLIIGSDNYENFEKWKSHDRLIRENQVFVYPRNGFKPNLAGNSPFTFIQSPEIDISSTLIRELIQAKKEIRYLVPEMVREYLKKKNLYLGE